MSYIGLLIQREEDEENFRADARYDYLSEAFGDEARLLAAQAADEAREAAGFQSAWGEYRANQQWLAKQRCAAAIRRNHAVACMLPSEDVPF